jgi:hypothetical protein
MPWRVVANAQVLAVHAAMLHTGQVLYFGGDEHDAGHHASGDIDHTRLFDAISNVVTTIGSPNGDVFCAGHAFVVDGRLLVAGGTDAFPGHVGGPHAPHFPGLRDSWAFNPRTSGWTQAAPMNPEPGRTSGGGRWYPTLVTLASGTVLALSGHPKEDDSRHDNDSPETFSPSPRPAGTWRLIGPGADPAHAMSYYPRSHVLPDGDLFIVTPVGGQSVRLRAETNAWRNVCPAPADGIYHGLGCSSVLLPLLHDQGYRARVLICGGTQPMVIDFGTASPGWTNTAARTLPGSPRREHANAVLLPTGQVFVCGGASNPNSDATGVLAGEIYDPQSNSWSTTEPASVVRNYHSVALLLPDGRVWTAGSNINSQQSFPTPGTDNRELRIEVYEPPYFRADRPQLIYTPSAVGWGQAFDVRTTQADRIARVALIRAGSVTHAFNSDQRYISLDFRRIAGEWLDAKAPPSSAIAPAGYYMLFTINRDGVPSVGRFVRLAPNARSSSYMIQGNLGRKGNFEVVVGRAGGGLVTSSRNNDAASLPWSPGTVFATGAGSVESVPSLIQSNFGNPGNLEVVARIGDRLAHFWRDSGPPWAWHGPTFFAGGVSGNPALIQGIFGGRGNFELVVPLAIGGLAHYWRDNDAPGLPWRGPTPFGTGAGRIDAVAMIQSNFGDPGNLEVIARIGDRLGLFWRLSGPPWTWNGPSFFFTGARGVPSFVQSSFGARGNFELVTPLAGGGLAHLWRANDAPGLPWSTPSPTFGGGDQYDAAALVEGNFGNPGPGGNLELMARVGNNSRFFWRQDGPPWQWSPAAAPPV